MNIRYLQQSDYKQVRAIYEAGLNTGIASFETESLDWEDWDKKYLKACRFVAEIENKVVGWVALTPFSKRAVYRGVAELSLYIDPAYSGRGIGNMLLEKLIEEAQKEGFWTLQAAIFPENKASIHLHQKNGFRIVGFREKIAQRDGQWYDNVLMEKRFTTVSD